MVRQFNRSRLGMEDYTTESDLEKLIGVGKRWYAPDNQHLPVTNFIESYHKRITHIFESTPIAKNFGISIVDAMNMPVDRWYYLEKQAKAIAERAPPDSDRKLDDLVTVIKQMLEVMTLTRPE